MREALPPALRRGLLIALPVGVSAFIELRAGSALAGAVTVGALIGGFVAYEAPALMRARWQLLAAPVIGLSAALGVLSSQSSLAAALTMGAFAGAAALFVVVSPRAALAAMMCVLALLVAQGLYLEPSDAFPALLLAAAGTLIQAAVALATWAVSDRERESAHLRADIRSAWRDIAAELRPGSAGVRHALRWALALGGGVAVYRFAGMTEHGYWIPLTVLFVLKPGLDDTRERMTMRALGTVIGLAVATGLAELIAADPLPVAICLTLAMVVAYGLLALQYAAFTAGITVFVVLLSDALGEPAWRTADERAVGTAVGIAIAVLSFALWPERPRGTGAAAPGSAGAAH